MKIGIGLPTTIPGVRRHEVLDWARRADAAGFSSLGTLDRLVYPNWEPLVALGAAAAVTERIGLTTAILILPYRAGAAVVAKQAATAHALSGGRLVLGEERGFAGGIGPDVSDNPPPLILGGRADAAFRRAARYGEGWIMGGAPPDAFPPMVEKLDAAWRAEGREGEPRRMAITYFSLDEDPEAQARRTLGHYYAIAGDYAEMIVAGTARGEDEVRERVRAFEQVGCDELIMFPASSDPGQVDGLAAAVL